MKSTFEVKRALATFVNSFGLALYDREQAGVRKTRGASSGRGGEVSQTGPWVLRSSTASVSPATTHQRASSQL